LDSAIQSREMEWIPSAQELQIRHATPAYSMFRMLTRTAGSGSEKRKFRAIEGLVDFPHLGGFWSEGKEDAILTLFRHGTGPLRPLGADHDVGDSAPTPSTEQEELLLDLGASLASFRYRIERITTPGKEDEILSVKPVSSSRQSIALPPKSLVQMLYLSEDLAALEDLELKEDQHFSQGSSTDLQLHQTTLLRVEGKIDGRVIDLSQLCVQWNSSHAGLVRVGQGGLVQRIRSTKETVTITARILPSHQEISLTIPPDLKV